jgi:hypothetical protein
MQEERIMHDAKLAKMEAEMKAVFQVKVMEKEGRLKQSEEELYARHREMKESLEKQRLELEDKKRRVESGRPLTPERNTVRPIVSAVCTFPHAPCRPKRRALVSSATNSDARVRALLRRRRGTLCHLSSRCFPVIPFAFVSVDTMDLFRSSRCSAADSTKR